MATAVRLSDYFKPTDKQRQFLDAIRDHKYVLYGGAAGGGKSMALRWAALRFLLDCAARGLRGVQVGIFSETFPSLRDRQITPFRSEVPAWLGDFNKTEWSFTLKPEFGSGILMFRNLDNASKFQSVQFAAIAVEELTRNPEQTFYDLIFRLRWPGIEDTRFFAATNPGHIGHAWVKKLWVDQNFRGTEFDPAEFAYVQALPADNPYLSKTYLRILDSLPEAMRRAMRDGDWNLFEGQFFSEFGPDHIVDSPFIPNEWERGVAVDWGFADPWCVLWGARDPATGRIIVYRELYEKQVPDDQQAKQILLEGATELRSWAVGDPAMFGRKSAGEGSQADTYSAAGLTLLPAFNDRVAGWQTMRQAMAPLSDGKPGLLISSACPNLIRTLPEMTYDQRKGGEDLNTKGEDHAVDAARYLCAAFKAFNEPIRLDQPKKRKRAAFARSFAW